MGNMIKKNNKSRLGSVVAGVAGAVAVAGVTVAATIALKDKKTREKVKKAFTNIKNQAMDYVETLETDKKGIKKPTYVKPARPAGGTAARRRVVI